MSQNDNQKHFILLLNRQKVRRLDLARIARLLDAFDGPSLSMTGIVNVCDQLTGVYPYLEVRQGERRPYGYLNYETKRKTGCLD